MEQYANEKKKIENLIVNMTGNDELDIYALLCNLLSEIEGTNEELKFLKIYDNESYDIGKLFNGDFIEAVRCISESLEYNINKDIFVIEDGKIVSLDQFEYCERLLSCKGRIISGYIKIKGIDETLSWIEHYTH